MRERQMKSRGRPRLGAREALRREAERLRRDQIRRLLAMPMHRRVWFLRVPRPDGARGSSL